MNSAKVELHLHLDGSLNLKWAYEKALQRGVIEEGTSFTEFYDTLYDFKDQPFKKFDYVCGCLQHYEDLEEATYLLTKRLYELGLIYAEIRFASQQHCLAGLSQLEACEAVCAGAKRGMDEFDIKIGVINCLMHKGDSAKVNEAENIETVKATKAMLGKGVVGIDLAGFEINCPFEEYESIIRMAVSEGIPVTCHAGEFGPGKNVTMAYSWGANRIGHGIHCIDDEEVLKEVIEKRIPLEICVTSNTGNQWANVTYATHPIRDLIKMGANVNINTDNQMFSRTDLNHEYNLLRMLGLTEEELYQCTLNSIDAAFVDDATKAELRKRLEAEK